MGYIDDNLVPGERVVYRAHLHWRIFLIPLLPAILLVLTIVFALDTNLFVPLAVTFGLITFGTFLWEYLDYISSEFGVTDKRVLIKDGLLQRRTVETLLTKVENISVNQSVTGRVLNFGTVSVTGTGGTREEFKNIANPLEFRRQIQAETLSHEERRDATGRLSGGGGGGSGGGGGGAGVRREERECPYCAELILKKARVCKHCGRDVEPVGGG